MYYRATIVTNLALARSVNYVHTIVIYDNKELYKLNCTFYIVNDVDAKKSSS
jgi:hypothetical protein